MVKETEIDATIKKIMIMDIVSEQKQFYVKLISDIKVREEKKHNFYKRLSAFLKAVWFFFTVMLIVTMIASFLCYLFNQLQLAYTFIMLLFVGVSVEVVMFALYWWRLLDETSHVSVSQNPQHIRQKHSNPTKMHKKP